MSNKKVFPKYVPYCLINFESSSVLYGSSQAQNCYIV